LWEKIDSTVGEKEENCRNAGEAHFRGKGGDGSLLFDARRLLERMLSTIPTKKKGETRRWVHGTRIKIWSGGGGGGGEKFNPMAGGYITPLSETKRESHPQREKRSKGHRGSSGGVSLWRKKKRGENSPVNFRSPNSCTRGGSNVRGEGGRVPKNADRGRRALVISFRKM